MNKILQIRNSSVEQIRKMFAGAELIIQECNGSHFAAADVAVTKGNKTNHYKIAVIEHNLKRTNS